MTPPEHPTPLLYEWLLRVYPEAFRARFGEGMRHAFAQELSAARARGGLGLAWFWVRSVTQTVVYGLLERLPVGPLFREWNGAVLRDLIHGARRLRRSPGFTAAAALTLSLGVGGTAAMFALVDGVILNPLPYPDADRLVAVQHRADAAGLPLMGVSLGTYVHYRESNRTLEEMTVYNDASVSILGSDGALRVPGAWVSQGFFELLLDGRPLLGRAIGDDDQRPGAPLVAMISYDLWQSRYGGAPDLIGQQMSVDGAPAEIVGVLPPSFDAPSDETQVWLPQQLDPQRVILGGFGRNGIARLRPGVSAEAAQADLERLVPSLADRFNPTAFDLLVTGGGLTPVVRPLKDTVVGSMRQTLWILLATVVFVLGIAAANVANLFLVRAESHRRELAVRSALGASRGAMVRHHLSESLLLGALAGAAGVGLAWLGIRWVVRWGPEALPRLHELTIGGQTVAVALGLAILCATVFGLLPLVRGTVDVHRTMSDGSRGNTAGRSRHRMRNALVVVQMALALILLVGSGLMVRTFMAIRSVDPGIDTESALVFQVGLPRALYPEPEEAFRFQQRVLDEVRSLPGVVHAGAALCTPLTDCSNETPVYPDDMPVVQGQTPPSVDVIGMTAGYAEALGIQVLEGRTLLPTDAFQEPPAALVNKRAADRMWPGQSALGQRIHADFPDDPPFTVVGVLEDIRSHALVEDPPETLYVSFLGSYPYMAPPHTLGFVVRTAVPPLSVAPAVRAALQSLDPNVPLSNLRTMEDVFDEAGAPAAFSMILLVGSALVALVLGTVGIYGVLSYVVSQRTGEIGVRMAMGAQATDVSGMVVRQGSRVVMAGVLAGLVGALVLTRLMAAMLYGVEALDLTTFAVVTVGLVSVALVASYLPARRAASVDPVTALRAG